MATAVIMPALGESVTEGTVTTWLKSVGDTVSLDEPLVEVSTDKVDSEVPSPAAGVLLEILVAEDETVAVGTQLALIGDASEAPASSPAPTAAAPAPAPAAPAPAAAPVAAAPTAPAAPAPAVAGTDVLMPALGESVSEGTVTTWLKSVGDQVEADEPLLEVSTDKVDSEVPAPVSGYLAEIRVAEDETVAVGTVVAVITASAPSAAPAAPAAPAPVAAAPAPAAPAAPVAAAPAAPAASASPFPTADSLVAAAAEGAKVVAAAPAAATTGYVTPIVRKLAREAGIDLASLQGTGIGGRIRREDVEAAIAAAAQPAPVAAPAAPAPATPAPAAATREPSPLRGTTEKMSRLRQTIARRMVESLQTAAQLTTIIEVDVTKIASLRARAKDSFAERENTKLTFLPFFVKAATEALLYHPKINATISDKEVTYFDHEHVGIAVDTERGLLVPVIKDAGGKSLADISRSINDLAARTRNSTIGPDELSGSTFTVTNTGSGGALFDTPVLNMPETAIMGVGTIVKRPVVVKDALGQDSIAIRSMVYLSLSYDHRLVDGADASRFLMDVKRRLEEGAFESELGL